MTQLTEHVWQLSLRGVNAYLVEGDDLTLVDAGTPRDGDRIRTQFEDIGVTPADVDRVLVTHYDIDHVGTLAGLAGDLDAPVYAGAPDADLLAGTRSPPLTNHKGLLQRVFGLFLSTPDLEIRTVDDGEQIGPFTAYHTPGHSPGHMAYVAPDLDVGMLGDLVVEADGRLDPSSWLMSYDLQRVQESITRLAREAPDFEVAAVGHGSPITAGGSEALRDLATVARE